MDIKKLKELRFENNISQWELAKISGIHQSKISLIENNLVKPTEKEIRTLEEIFKKLSTERK